MTCCCLPLIKDIVQIITALLVVIVALVGISKWKSEFRGKANFEVSYKLLKSIYRLRDSFLALRANFISVNEMLPKEDGIKDYAYENTRFVINNRLKPFNEAYNEFKSILPEVEILFSKELKGKCIQINRVISLYQGDLHSYMQLYSTTNREHFAELQKGVFMQTKEDKYITDLENIISSIETEISRHIKMK